MNPDPAVLFRCISLFKYLLTAAVLMTAVPTLAEPAPSVKWHFQTLGPIWAPSTTLQNTTYVGSTDGALYALDTRTGKMKWRFQTAGPIFGGVQVSGGQLYFASDDGFLYKLRRRDGRELWRVNLHRHPVVERRLPEHPECCAWDYRGATPVTADGVLYVGSADQHLYAVSVGAGKVLWSFATGGQLRSAPAIETDHVIFGGYDGKVTALNRHSGELLWQHETGQPIVSSPLVARGKVFIGSRDTYLYALDVNDGRVLWKKPYHEGSWVESSAAAWEDKLYIGSSDWRVTLALSAADGAILWATKAMDGGHFAPPAVTPRAIYQGVYGHDQGFMPEGGIAKIARESGSLVWTFAMKDLPDRIGHGVVSAPELVEDTLLFGALDGAFYALTP